MYSFIKGEVVECNGNSVVIDCNGVGYDIIASASCVSAVKVGEVAKIFTYLAISQDDIRLFGFVSAQEKNMFLKLTGISGIGPKSAIDILSGMDLPSLALAIYNGDVKSLSKIKGVGKKSAERIILELRDKMGAETQSETPVIPMKTEEVNLEVNMDAVTALMSFGLNKNEATQAVKKVQKEGMSVEQIIFKALQQG
jgi:Holliday junction DNA helicase RuvA